MTRLTELETPAKPSRAAEPHRFRARGGRVHVATASGARATLSTEDYRRFAAGKLALPAGPLAAGEPLSAWRGPATVIVELGSPETAQAAVDLAFSIPSAGTRLELAGASRPEAWPALWLCVELAERRAEWAKRPLELRARLDSELPADRADFLGRRSVRVVRSLKLDGAPRALPRAECFRADAAAGAKDAAGWCLRLKEAGAESVRLGLGAPARFFADFVRASLETGGPVEEWSAGLLSGRRWLLPGYDLLSEIYVDASGAVYASEAGAARGEALKLGEAASLRWDELGSQDLARACLAAAAPESQPVCLQCVYSELCSVAPSASLAEQGGLWGRTPTSARCAAQMGRLDALFDLLEDPELARGLRGWTESV